MDDARSLFSEGPGALTLALCALAIVALEIGYALGRRASAREGRLSHASGIQTAMLGLLGLLLGFTFSMAAARYDRRKAIVLEEANAIGTAHLRAAVAPGPYAARVDALLARYVDARLAFYRAAFGSPELAALNARCDALQGELWSAASALAREEPSAIPTGLLLVSLNDVIDARAAQVVAFDDRIPEAVLAALFVIATLSMAVVGYVNGLTLERHRTLSLVLVALVAATILLVLDLDRPRRGFIRLGEQSLVDVQRQLAD